MWGEWTNVPLDKLEVQKSRLLTALIAQWRARQEGDGNIIIAHVSLSLFIFTSLSLQP